MCRYVAVALVSTEHNNEEAGDTEETRHWQKVHHAPSCPVLGGRKVCPKAGGGMVGGAGQV